jgi:hypothetical protein
LSIIAKAFSCSACKEVSPAVDSWPYCQCPNGHVLCWRCIATILICVLCHEEFEIANSFPVNMFRAACAELRHLESKPFNVSNDILLDMFRCSRSGHLMDFVLKTYQR